MKKIASAVISSALVLFAVVFAPIGIMAATNAESYGSEWSSGSNMINVVFAWIFAIALLGMAAVAVVAVVLAARAKSIGLLIYAVAVTALLLIGAIGLTVAAVVMVSG